MQIYCVLTLDCNLNCPHCIRKFSGSIVNEQMETKTLLSVLREISSDSKKHQIILTGGEPTLHKDFFKILQISSVLFGNVVICSNGVISEQTIQKISEYKSVKVQISLDGSEYVHDKIRGKGSFSKALNTISKLLESHIELTVSSTVNKLNIYSMFELAGILSKFKLNSWKISPEQTFSEQEKEKLIETDVWNQFVDRIIHVAKNRLSVKKFFDFDLFQKMEEKYGKEFLSKNSVTNCGFCSSKIYIYPDFSVKACTCLPEIVLGKLSIDSFSVIRNSMKKMKSKCIPDKESPCFLCKWKYICNGGCPGYSFYYKGKIGFGDFRCPIVKNYYEV